MKKFDYFEFRKYKRENGTVDIVLEYLEKSKKAWSYLDADQIAKEHYPYLKKEELPSNYFGLFDDSDNPLILIKRKDLGFLLFSDKGNMLEILYLKNRGPLAIKEKDHQQAMSRLIRVIENEQNEILSQDPSYLIENDQKKRMSAQKRFFESRLLSLKLDPELPDEFWDTIHYVYNWSKNGAEFKSAFNGYDVSTSSCRQLERVARASYALDEPNNHSDESITIYRALPQGYVIEEGDWISTSESYASGHESNSPQGKGITISENVYFDEIYETSSQLEMIYVPRGTWKGFESLDEVWKAINNDNKPSQHPSINKRTLSEIMIEQKDFEMNG